MVITSEKKPIGKDMLKIMGVRQKMDEQFAADLTRLKKANRVTCNVRHLATWVTNLQRVRFKFYYYFLKHNSNIGQPSPYGTN